MKPEVRKNRKNVGLELRSTHYILGKDRNYIINIISFFRMELFIPIS